MRTLLGILGGFVSLGWGAVAHLYTLVYSLPTMKRVEDLEREVARIREGISKDRVDLEHRFGRLTRIAPRHRTEDENEDK